jgi:Ca2+-binding RTX toxin-like protein
VDTVESTSSYTLGGGLENLVLKEGAAVGVGNSANNSIIGTSLANTLDGGLGNDTLSGGDGNDYYIVDAALDSIQESSLAGGGVDTVESKSSYTLGGGLESLVLKDGAAVGVGNSANNNIIGTSLANTLDGGLGNDTLSGGDGNDYYIVDASLDSIQESSLAGGGVDTVESKSSYTLGGGLENLVLKDGAAVGVGNSANNSIIGTSLANTLDGGLGNDTLSGGDGNDYYIVDAAQDSIQESSLAGGGVDTVESKSSYTLGGGLENLVLKDGAAVGVGNSANNNIIGTSLANTLDGGLGNDTLSGGDGNDYYIVDASLDSIQESSLAGGGVDTVESTSSYTLGGGLENLVLKEGAAVGVGNSANNSIIGTSLANTLDGGLGNDTLSGGDGNDLYLVDNAGDVVIESSLAGGGVDTVESTSSYTLGGGLENLVLKDGAAVGVGNSANNSIIGTSLANTVDGGLGNDTLSGGDGNDLYLVDNAGDVVIESSLAGGGVDTVESKSSYTLEGGLEN